MRRKDKEVSAFAEIQSIIRQCPVCRLGMVGADGYAYIVPMNFGYEIKDDSVTLYLHSAASGTKIDILKQNSQVSVQMDYGHELIAHETACGHGFQYASVMGRGTVEFLSSLSDKKDALQKIMEHQTGQTGFAFPDERVTPICVMRLPLHHVTAKRSPAHS